MNWDWFGLIIALIILIFAIFRSTYKGGKQLLGFSIKKRFIQFATPKRVELILIALFFMSFFIMDVSQNKLIDFGKDYQVIVLWNLTAPVILVWEIALIVFHICLLALFGFSLKSKRTSNIYDWIVGGVALFCVALLFGGVMVQMHSDTAYFLGANIRGIDLYHLGIYGNTFAGFWWAFTD